MRQNLTGEAQNNAALEGIPEPGEFKEIAPGVLWARFDLPFALNHVNIYLVEDGAGWAVIDTGIGDERTKAIWRAALEGPLRGRALTRLIVTHHHPDHMGLAGWLSAEFDLPVHMSEMEFMYGRYFMSGNQAAHGEFHNGFYARHGMPEEQARITTERGHRYLELITGLPDWFEALEQEVPLNIGGREFRIFKGAGHSPDQAMLYCADENLFFAADQVLDRITPNISVYAPQPLSDPLGRYLDSLDLLKREIADGALTLPGHEMPLTRLHSRIDALKRHHQTRCDIILEKCRKTPLTVADITPALFRRELDPHQMSFAFSEALAHVNYLVRQGRLSWVEQGKIWRAETV